LQAQSLYTGQKNMQVGSLCGRAQVSLDPCAAMRYI
jgi:hypothetical protein